MDGLNYQSVIFYEAFDLGINAPEKDRVQFRRVTTCAPLVTEGYKNSVQVEGAEANYTRYFYGPNTAQSSEPNAPTYVYPEFSFSEWKKSSFISVSSAFHLCALLLRIAC